MWYNGQSSVPPEQLQNVSEKLSDVHEKVSQLVSMLGHVTQEQKQIKHVLHEVKFKQEGFHSVLESLAIIESLDSAERNIVAEFNGRLEKIASQPSAQPSSSNSVGGKNGQSEQPYKINNSNARASFSRWKAEEKKSHQSNLNDVQKAKDIKKVAQRLSQCQQAIEVESRTEPRVTRTSQRLAATKRSSVSASTGYSRRRRSRENLQLNRQRFAERCQLEAGLLSNFFTVCNFFVMLTLYLVVQTTYDPVDFVNEIHEGLRNKFKIEDDQDGPDACNSPDDIMDYTQRFLVQSFDLASALIDANTFEAIEMDRCLSDSVNDICRLKYWKVPQNSNKLNYFNKTLFDDDQLTTNNALSIMDCASSPSKPNCINRSDPRFVATLTGGARTFGLTPEDPIIMDSRMDYPHASVIPLTPIVWQTRAVRVDCSGFGDQYNRDILGAGDCHADVTCDPDRVTEFFNAKDNLLTHRRQSIFVTYVEPAFTCVDRRQGKEASAFKDKSWSPWATFQDLTTGKDANKGTVRGQEVYWKFVSDVAYLQAPFQVYLRDDVNPTCTSSDVVCNASSVHCKDPLEDPNHPMWGESNKTQFPCSFHEHYASQFLSLDPKARKNTFLTIDTTEFTMAAIVITPFSDDFPDIATLLTVTFSISQSGYISASSVVASVSETETSWYICLACQVFCTGIYFLYSIKGAYEFLCLWWRSGSEDSQKREPLPQKRDPLPCLDIILSLSVIGHGVAALLIDRMPPHVTEELMEALTANNQAAYFDVINTIMDYQATSNNMRDVGFAISLFLFLRLNVYLSLHPRLAILARTLKGAGDDMFHLAIYCLLLMLFLTILAWWSFGHNTDAFSSIGRTAYRLTRMFAGDALFADSDRPPSLKLFCFLIVYIFLVFFILFNFFLAIIVNMYTAVQTFEAEVNVTDNSLPVDLYDCFKTRVLLIKCKVVDKLPATVWFLERYLKLDLSGHTVDPRDLVAYLAPEGPGFYDDAAVTPEELLDIRLKGKPLFTSLEQAEKCIHYYMLKVEEAGGDQWVLEETNPDKLYPKGAYFNPSDPMSSRPGIMREWPANDDDFRLGQVQSPPQEERSRHSRVSMQSSAMQSVPERADEEVPWDDLDPAMRLVAIPWGAGAAVANPNSFLLRGEVAARTAAAHDAGFYSSSPTDSPRDSPKHSQRHSQRYSPRHSPRAGVANLNSSAV